MSSNILTYSIAQETLQGSIGQESFYMRAWSGGGRGRTGSGAEHSYDSYDVFRKEKGNVRGGPLPPGLYICRFQLHHPKFHRCIYLEPTITAMFQVDSQAHVHVYDRDGFYIHGRGPVGSMGCIVPENEADRQRLNEAVKNATTTVLLKVADVGMPFPAVVEKSTQLA